MDKYIILNQGSQYKNYDFVVEGDNFVFDVPYMLSDDGKRYSEFQAKIIIENAVNMTHIQLVTEFSNKIEEMKNGYLLG